MSAVSVSSRVSSNEASREERAGPVAAPAASGAPAIADPGALGLAAFALTTFVLSVFNAGWLDAKLMPVVLPLAFFYGGIVQVAAGMWEFRRNNTFAATVFSSYGAFWISFAAFAKFVAPQLPAADANQAAGIFLLAWTIFTVFAAIAVLRTNKALITTFAFLIPTFVLLTAGAFASSASLTKAGGWFGVATALLAWYASAAVLVNTTHGRTVLPLGPVGH